MKKFILFSFILVSLFTYKEAFALSENFDSYSLGNLAGQGNWTTTGTGGQVVNTHFSTSNNSYQSWRNGVNKRIEKTDTTSEDIVIVQFDYLETDFTTGVNNPAILYELFLSGDGVGDQIIYTGGYPTSNGGGDFRIGGPNLNSGYTVVDTELVEDVWYTIRIELDFINMTVRGQIDNNGWSETTPINTGITAISKHKIESVSATGNSYIDSIVNTNDIAVVGVTSSSPTDLSENVNTFTTFEGLYSNDSSYEYVGIKIENLTSAGVPDINDICTFTEFGENIPFNCSFTLLPNTDYQYSFYLQDTLNSRTLFDENAPISFSTGEWYEPTGTVVTSASCETFDFGCHLESAISWTFGVNQATLNKFSTITLENRIPFAYLYDMGNLYNEMFDRNAEDFEIKIDFLGNDLILLSTTKLEEVPFQPLVRTTIGAIMIFMTAMFLYRKLLGVHNEETIIKEVNYTGK